MTWTPFIKDATMKRYQRSVVIFVLIATFLGWLFDPFHFSAATLPAVSDITSMEARTFQSRDSEGQFTPFSVSEAHWGAVIKSLQPAKYDYAPAKWVGIGELTITRKSGGPLKVFLFSVSAEAGAFAVGKDWDDRAYYRGGDSQDLERALQMALDDQARASPATHQ